MVLSDKQRRLTLREIQKLTDELATIGSAEFEVEWHREVQIAAIQSQIEVLEQQVVEYDMLKSGGITFAKSFSLEQLPDVLVQARIASGMTQTKLALQLNLKPQQIQRYESSKYQGASLARLTEVARALHVNVEGMYRNQQDEQSGLLTWADANDVIWRKFPIREMVKRNWFHIFNDEDEVQATKRYFESACEDPTLAAALHRKKVRGDAAVDEYSLLAWQVRILQQANLQIENLDFPKFRIDERWLPELKALTRKTDGPKKAVNLLANHGIVLVIEERFERTYLDGGAMLNTNGNPVIGLTLRYDRLDNFWFVLFHELGHVFLHLMSGYGFDFFDDDAASTEDTLECEADEFALDNLIAPNEWEMCLSRNALTIEAVKLDAERLQVDPSIIAGRIRKEREDFSLLNELVGQNDVRIQFDS